MGEEDHSVGLHKAELRPAVRNYKVMHVKALKKKKRTFQQLYYFSSSMGSLGAVSSPILAVSNQKLTSHLSGML